MNGKPRNTGHGAFLVASAAILVFLSACSGNNGIHNARFETRGGLVDVTIIGVPSPTAKAAIDALKSDFAVMETVWGPGALGPLAHANEALASGTPFSLPPSILPLIERGRDFAKRSQGLVNPALGKLAAMWRLDVDSIDFHPPEAEKIAALLDSQPSLDQIEADGYHMRCTNPEVALTFSAFLKGYAIDQAILRLREFGIEDALITTGGNLHAIGSRAGLPWRVTIRRANGTGVLATLNIQGDESVFSVGAHDEYRSWKGTIYHSILDPRTGQPGLLTRSVTVIHPEAATAQAAATALFIAGPREWPRIAASMGVDQVLVVDASGGVHMTPEMERRLRFLDGAPVATISEPGDRRSDPS